MRLLFDRFTIKNKCSSKTGDDWNNRCTFLLNLNRVVWKSRNQYFFN